MNIDEEKILTYKMTLKEAKAYRLALLWIKLTRKFLPKDTSLSNATLPKGDPRKGYLFKLCWKLLRETEGILSEQDYKYYFVAQISMLKSIQRSKGHAHISHNVFVGEKAWVRWKIWKKKFDEKAKNLNIPIFSHEEDKVINDLDQTKVFLNKNPKFSKEDIKNWFNLGKIPLTYIELSPKIKKLIPNPSVEFNYDPSLIERKLTGKVRDHFQNIFNNEFN